MAQYYTDFSEYADTAALEANWTERWHTSSTFFTLETDLTEIGGKVLEWDKTPVSNTRSVLSWNALDSDPDRAVVEVLARVKTTGTGPGQIGALVRGSGTDTSETGMVGQLNVESSEARIARYDDAIFTLSGVGGTSSTNEWYWLKFLGSGTVSFKLKIWQGDPVLDEPASWAIETTAENVTGAGWVGLMAFEQSMNYCSVFSVGTGGDAAPTSAVATTPTLSLPFASNITASSAVPNVTVTF